MAKKTPPENATHETLMIELSELVAADTRVCELNGVAWDVATALERIPTAAAPQSPHAKPSTPKK